MFMSPRTSCKGWSIPIKYGLQNSGLKHKFMLVCIMAVCSTVTKIQFNHVWYHSFACFSLWGRTYHWCIISIHLYLQASFGNGDASFGNWRKRYDTFLKQSQYFNIIYITFWLSMVTKESILIYFSSNDISNFSVLHLADSSSLGRLFQCLFLQTS